MPKHHERAGIDDIIAAVARRRGLSVAAIKGPSRTQRVSEARQAAVSAGILLGHTVVTMAPAFGRSSRDLGYLATCHFDRASVDKSVHGVVEQVVTELGGGAS